MTLRNVRNHNPGNMERGDDWQGLAPIEMMTPAQQQEPRFAVFIAPGWGFRALCIELRTYVKDDGCKTLADVIARWAPPEENDTEAYITDVSRKASIDPNAPLNVDDTATLTELARAITSHETAGPLPYAQSFYPFWKDVDLEWGVQHALGQSSPTTSI